MFITLQTTCAYLSIFDMLYWDSRCLTIFTGWVWLVWLLTLDALTPKVRALMKFKNWYAAPVLLFSISVQVFITEQVVNSTSIDIQDRVLWNPSFYGYSAEFRAVPFFLSRVVTLLLWSLRILWRLLTSDKDDLIMIQGSVDFFGTSKRRQALAFQYPCCRRSSPVRGPPTRILPHPS
uniref:Uncharacterized protein n=1 Tax=Globisporangium ultimum (strain ATCC 200006 / CBS 805.95 / DAOM BR144) TaxID=431595 RepID=K3WWN2_GLOUD